MTPYQALLMESHRDRRARWNAIAIERQHSRMLGYTGPKSISYAPAPLPLPLINGTERVARFDFHATPGARSIASLVALKHGMKPGDLLGDSRHRDIVWARYEAIYLVRTHTDMSTTAIGKAFGGRDHTTIVNSLRQYRKRLEVADAA